MISPGTSARLFSSLLTTLILTTAARAGVSNQPPVPLLVDIVADNLEVGQNAEPSIALNPSNASQAFITAFGETKLPSPIFYTSNGGATWSLFDRVTTFDASLAWPAGGAPYLAHLTGETNTGLVVRTTSMPLGATGQFKAVPGGSYLPSNVPDQPWMEATRVNGVDRIYIALNDLSQRSGKTATIHFSLDGGTVWQRTIIETLKPKLGADMPPVRVVATGEKVYAVFERPNGYTGAAVLGDIVVVKDTAGGLHNFKDLGASGVTVAASEGFPQGSLGQERIGSDLSLAVSPTNTELLYVAFGATDPDGREVVKLFKSLNGGSSWQKIFQTRDRSAMPALAVAQNGTVGLMYTSYFIGRLETHFSQSPDDFAHWNDTTLSRFEDTLLTPEFDPFIGDYERIGAVGNTFYGTFSAANDTTLFPFPVTFLRDKSMLGKQVKYSIDPFYFTLPALTSIPAPTTTVTAVNDTLILRGDEPSDVFATLNDSDGGGDIVTVKSIADPIHGVAIKVGTGSIFYTPGPDFTGTDSFTYTAINSLGQTASATVNVLSPFFSAAGTFSGLVTNAPASQASRGILTVQLTRTGDFSGTLRLVNTTYRFTGEFAIDGQSVATVQLANGPITLSLSLDFATRQLSANVSDGLFASTATLRRAASSGSDLTGSFNFALSEVAPSLDPTLPHGHGYAKTVVSRTGAIRTVGVLADGTAFSASSGLSEKRDWSLYVPLYKNLGSLSGEIMFGLAPQFSVQSDAVAWIKPNAPGASRFKSGFHSAQTLAGARYSAPTPGSRLILDDQTGAGTAAFGTCERFPAFGVDFLLSTANKFSAAPVGANSLKMSVIPSSGLFSGSVKAPGATATTSFKGIILPGSNSGLGFFLSPAASGSVELGARH